MFRLPCSLFYPLFCCLCLSLLLTALVGNPLLLFDLSEPEKEKGYHDDEINEARKQ
jgi:hypothetical protein